MAAEEDQILVKVLLHVGHAKTGTSSIQSALSRSVDSLAQVGLSYPSDPNFSRAARGGLSTGNARNLILRNKGQLSETFGHDVAQARRLKHTKVLYSSEFLFRYFVQNQRLLPKVGETLSSLNSSVEILLFVRDPLDYAVSMYQQRVKRNLESRDFEAFLSEFHPLNDVHQLLVTAKEAGIVVQVKNYSDVKNRLLRVFEEMLCVPSGTLVSREGEIVNRSLTAGELELQRLINSYSATSTCRQFSDRWVEELPGLEPDFPYCSEHGARVFLDACLPLIPVINKLASQGIYDGSGARDHELLSKIPRHQSQMFCFSHSQMDLIARGIAQGLDTKSANDAQNTPKKRGVWSRFWNRIKMVSGISKS